MNEKQSQKSSNASKMNIFQHHNQRRGNGPPVDGAESERKSSKWLFIAPAAILGGLATVAAAPVVVAAAGFGAGGIAAGSLAASMMSSAWTTGVGVGVVSALQSIGAAGMGAAATALVGATGAAAGAGIGGIAAAVAEGDAKADQGRDHGRKERASQCELSMENYTRYILRDLYISIAAAVPSDIITGIEPAKQGTLVLGEISEWARCSQSIVSWLICGMNRRVVVMWDLPDPNVTQDWQLAVGLTRPGVSEHTSGSTWLDQMRSGRSSVDLMFSRARFNHGPEAVVFEDGEFGLMGIIMKNDNTIVIKIYLKPACSAHLARPLKN